MSDADRVHIFAAAIAIAALLAAGPGRAQSATSALPSSFTPPAPTTAHIDMSVPAFTSSAGGLYDLNPVSAQSGPPGTITMSSTSPMPKYTLDDVLRNTHGYVSAGVSSNNGHGFSGGVIMPIVPGKADLALSAGTGQIGGFTPYYRGAKTPTIGYDTYGGALYLHPTDDLTAMIGISAVRLKANNPYTLPYYPLP